MVEEAAAVAWAAPRTNGPITGPEALSLLALPPAGDPPRHVRERESARALVLLQERTADLEAFAAGAGGCPAGGSSSGGARPAERPGAPPSRPSRVPT